MILVFTSGGERRCIGIGASTKKTFIEPNACSISAAVWPNASRDSTSVQSNRRSLRIFSLS
jgi:hypothetical protein